MEQPPANRPPKKPISIGAPPKHTFNVPPKAPGLPQEPPPKKRFSKMRLIIWAVEAVILLSCLEQFILKPRLKRKREAEALAALEAAKPQAQGNLVEALGEKARQIPHLTEVADAHLAPLDGLAEGSSSAQNAQISVSGTNSLPIEVVNSIGMAFRLIPAGTCIVGSPETEAGREKVEVPHVAAIPSHFYMGKYEVTQAEWKAVMGEDNNPSGYRGDRRPVEEITWYDCQRFTLKLCEMEEVPIGTYRLPTEAEWEYACRAGTSTAYCFGNDARRLGGWADYEENNYVHTVNVGLRRPNAYGLFDMHGNVWEWCLDDYKNYPGDETPTQEFHQYPVIRGGNWYVEARKCRSANRSRLPGASHGNMLGFRIIRMVVAPPPIQKRQE